MNGTEPGTKETGAELENVDVPFRPTIEGELKRRLIKYAKEKGRSLNSAVRWLMVEQLRREGY